MAHMKSIFLVFLIFIGYYSFGQKTKRVIIKYDYSYFSDGTDSIKIKRTPQTEWHKLTDIDQSLFVYASQTESSLDKSNLRDAEMYLSSLRNALSSYHAEIDLKDYEKEINFRKHSKPPIQIVPKINT